MEVNLLNPFVRYSRLFRENPMSVPSDSICHDCRIFFFKNISGSVTVGENKYAIMDKTGVYFPPETMYRFDINFSDESSVIILNFDLVNDFSHIVKPISPSSKSDFSTEKTVKYDLCPGLDKPIVRILPEIEGMLIRCTDNFIIKNEMYREDTSAVTKLILLEFLRQDTGSAGAGISKKVLEYIRGNFTNPALTNFEIAKAFNYHPYHLSSLIRAETGRSLHQFLIYYRLQTAKDMLITTDLSISEIAYRSGFETNAYFSKMFRQNFKISPKEYRLKNQRSLF